MKASFSQLFKPPLLWNSLASLGLPLSVALVMAVVTSQPNQESLGSLFWYWILVVLLGTLSHRVSWFLFFETLGLPYRRLRWQAAYLGLGILLTNISVIWYSLPQEWDWTPRLLQGMGWMSLQVVAISLLIHALMHFSGVTIRFADLHEEQRQISASLQVEIEGRSELIPKLDLRAIQVADHYITLWYQAGSELRQAMLYGALKDYEKATSGFLQRINRSTLVNLKAVWRHETNPKLLLYLEGIDEPFNVSRSNQPDILRQLA